MMGFGLVGWCIHIHRGVGTNLLLVWVSGIFRGFMGIYNLPNTHQLLVWIIPYQSNRFLHPCIYICTYMHTCVRTSDNLIQPERVFVLLIKPERTTENIMVLGLSVNLIV